MAMEAPPKTHAYVALLNPKHSGRVDGLATVALGLLRAGSGLE